MHSNYAVNISTFTHVVFCELLLLLLLLLVPSVL